MNNKLFGYISTAAEFDSLKLASDSTNTSYTLDGVTYFGDPDVRWEQLVFIEDYHKIWTHGKYYNQDVPIQTMTASSASISPNIHYKWSEVSSLTIDLVEPENANVANYYVFEFESGTTAPTLSIPKDLYWSGTESIKANRRYIVTIINKIAMIHEAKDVKPVVEFIPSNIYSDTSTLSSNTTQVVKDSLGNNASFTLRATNNANMSVTQSTTQSLRSWTVDNVTYSYNTARFINFGGSGSTSTRCIQVTLDGPCKITAVGYRTGNTTRYIYASIGGSQQTLVTCSSTTTLAQGSYKYTGSGTTLYIYGSGTGTCLAMLKIDYDV